MAVPTLGFDARWAPILQLLQQQQANPDTDINTYNDKSLPMWKRVGLQAPPISGPQQSYNPASNLQASNDGISGQAGRMESSYNNSPYVANNGNTMGTVANTGESRGAAQGSQGELVGKGGQGWNIYQTTPTWTGSPLSQSPEARTEGDFKAPPISGPQNPLLQRQAMIRQALIQRAFQNMPRGYQFQLAANIPGPRDTNIPPLNPADWNTTPRPPGSWTPGQKSPYDVPPRPRLPIFPGGKLYPEDFMG